jgi:argininosuccinate lyase
MSKMLHGGRLGSVREDVAKFCSSRKDDTRLADAVLAINKAHVVMLMEQKIIAWQDGTKILSALQKLSSQKLDPNAEDVHMAVEEAVLAETGTEVGGNMHLAKSRNDQVATAIRMTLRTDGNRRQTHRDRHFGVHSPSGCSTSHIWALFTYAL